MLAQLLIVLLSFLGATDVDDAVNKERLEQMLANDDELLIIATFKRHPDKVLPFVDSYLEGALAMIEDGKSEGEARPMYERGFQFAELASAASEDDIFIWYAASFWSWSPKERELFREGQQAYRQARRNRTEPREARNLLRESLDIARSLNDTWGEAMASAALARLSLELDRRGDAVRHGSRAAALYRRLWMVSSEIDAIIVVAQASESIRVDELERAWQLVRTRDEGDEQRRAVLQMYRDALEASGRGNEAETLPDV